MTHTPAALLSDLDLLDATMRAAASERRTTSELIALLAELDRRRLYLGEGYSSLFTYATLALHLSEPAAYSRITAARAARRFPGILTLLAEGALTLSTIGLLSAHLTEENHEGLLAAVRHKSKRDVERLVACLHPQPDIASSVRKLPASVRSAPVMSFDPAPSPRSEPMREAGASVGAAPAMAERGLQMSWPRDHRSLVAPLAPWRYLLRVTLSQDAHDKLERARTLLRHTLPHGDHAAVIERALTALIDQLDKTRLAATRRRRVNNPRVARTRHVPAAVKRVVWARDEGRCAFVGAAGRCGEQSWLEPHHVQPFADGGATDVDNLQLRCRAHNAYEATLYFGEECQQVAHQ